MDLNRATNKEKLELCKRYYILGFRLLPFVWAVNSIWFFNEAFIKPPYDEQKEIRKYVLLSSLGAVLFGAALVCWVIVFQTHREGWGKLGDDLSAMMPRGRA